MVLVPQSLIVPHGDRLAGAFAAMRLFRESTVLIHTFSSKKCHQDFSGDPLSQIRRNRMPVEKLCLTDIPLPLRIKHHQVRVETLGELPFPFMTAGQTRWAFRHPAD